MPLSRTALAALALVLVPLAAPVPARAAESMDACVGYIDSVPAVIETQGVWCLRGDLATPITSGAAITIQANNVTLDCNHYKVGGLAAGIHTQTAGIYGYYRLNTTVRNCVVRGFRIGLHFEYGSSLVRDNLFEANTYMGMRVHESVVRDNRVLDIGGNLESFNAIGIQTNGDAEIRGNHVAWVMATPNTNGYAFGINAIAGNGVSIIDNVVINPYNMGTGLASGIYTSNGSKAIIVRNQVAGYNEAGIGVRCNASNGLVKDNVIWGFQYPHDCIDGGGNAMP